MSPRVIRQFQSVTFLGSSLSGCLIVLLCKGPWICLRCLVVLFILVALALVNVIVGDGILISCSPMATTHVIIHWGPCYVGGGREVVCQDDE